jgi:hypothetical protein
MNQALKINNSIMGIHECNLWKKAKKREREGD